MQQNWFAEAYIIAEKIPDDNFKLSAIEFEAKRQLTEQGEYSADWGVLFEFERNQDRKALEVNSTLIVSKEMGHFIGTANLSLGYEYGRDINNEIETALAAQLRYRYKRALDPALELYISEDTKALGPIISGTVFPAPRKKLHWELGYIFGLNDSTPENSLRVLIEYEF